MITLHCDGSLSAESLPEHVGRPVKDAIEVPGDLIAEQPELIDRIFSFGFDQLGLQAIDLRIRPVSLDCPPEASCTAPCS
jgi:hypothetical protein